MSKKPLSFGEIWSRGWRVIGMLIVIQLIGWLCILPLYLLPESIQEYAMLLFLFALGPVICYWGFSMFYPDYQQQPDFPDLESAFCVSCQSAIPPDSDTCPKCGWTYKTK